MSIFRQNLPVQIIPKSNNPEGTKYQGVLEVMETDSMKIRVDDNFFAKEISGNIDVEFSMASSNFKFESKIMPGREDSSIRIQKPSVIHKSQIRKTTRAKTDVKFTFTLWTEGGRFEATMTDLSTVGIKMTGTKELQKNTLLSLNVFIPGASLRFICQGLVMWCKRHPEMDYLFETGVKFTTLSIDAIKKVDRFVKDKIQIQTAETN
ncbi:MAG: PilZ domain-containing protein [Leptospira sp.]|nr:PilZ domain-containing protein [Leptospira sp.]